MARPTKERGLILKNGIWYINKSMYGERVFESARTSKIREARELLAHRMSQMRSRHFYGPSFGELAKRYLADNQHKRSLERDRRAIALLDPFIGAMPANRVHHETLASFIASRLKQSVRPSTVNRELAVVRIILNLAVRVWRDKSGQPLLSTLPFIPMLRNPFPRDPYPLAVDEQRLLFSELDDHLLNMALFKVNTGLREQEVVGLRWDWEVKIPELNTSIFVIPRENIKTQRRRYVFLNKIARSVIAKCRGKNPTYVFTRNGEPVTKIYNSGWRAARTRAARRYSQELARPCPEGFRAIRVHDMKHTYGHRLRGAGVSFEDRIVLLGHRPTFQMTTHYSAAEVCSLIEASEKVCRLQAKRSAAIAVVRYETSVYNHWKTNKRVAAVPVRLAPSKFGQAPRLRHNVSLSSPLTRSRSRG